MSKIEPVDRHASLTAPGLGPINWTMEHHSAVIAFGSRREASRRIAGVAAAARIVREVAEAGLKEAWLELPAGEGIDAPVLADIRRVAGGMPVRIGPPFPDAAFRLPGDRLVWAGEMAAVNAGRVGLTEAGIKLDDAASAEILRRAGKSSDGPISRWLNRPVSRRISAILLHIPGLRPAHATAGTALLALIMFWAMVTGGPTGLLIGGLLFHVASVFDGVHGEVARATFRESSSGAVLDSVVDVGTSVLMVVGLAINLERQGISAAGELALWGLTLLLLGLALIGWRSKGSGGAFSLNHVKHYFRGRFAGALAPRLFAISTVITSRDFFSLAAAVCIVVKWPMVILYGLAAVTPLWIVFVAVSLLPAAKEAVGEEGAIRRSA